MRILNPAVHGILDYVAAAALIAAPFVLGLGEAGPVAMYLSVIGGVGLIVYSLLTDYAYSAAKLIPFKTHLVLDSLAGLLFIVVPFALGFEGVAKIYYIVMGVGVLIVVALTNATADTGTSADIGTTAE